ncbi:ubiquitin-specific protease ubp2 [Perkinsus olseni]|uniref:Ubiquitin-specific protease ubp2 n=1 Tax=Perkinsus olseni TaxID=32597 RepID=A0A7J6N774_PEROL|nr:ubiquitin-specific protease ubp2 [Perkinsus olseni]
MPNIPAGIDNFNYSACFSIAAAQGLRSLAPFEKRIVDGDDNNAPEPSGGLASTLQTLFEQMADGSKGPADIRSFFEQCKKVCPELMREPYRQHDSQVIASVSAGSKAALQLSGHIGWKCVRVNDSTSRIDMRQEMCQRRSVEMALLPPESIASSSSDLDWLIKATYCPQLNREVISDYHCDECKADTSCTRTTEIVSSMPSCLIVHIWRDMYFTGIKDTTYVSFDRYLNTFETPDGRQRYRLTGVVEHLGYSLNSGHYVAYVAREDEEGPDGHEQWRGGPVGWLRVVDGVVWRKHIHLTVP